jgi:hypothetical protein
MTLAGIGTFFGRSQTWWNPGKAWIDYLARSQSILQQGTAVADIAMFIGEDIPARAVIPEDLPVPLPRGYAYDSVNLDVLLRRATVSDGSLQLPGGARYRILILRPAERMTPELAARLAELSAAGLTIVGSAPVGLAGARDSASGDSKIRELATRMRFVSYVDATPLRKVLEQRGLPPDVEFADPARIFPEWTHRRGKHWDVYFFCNQTDDECPVEALVRATGFVELWDADAATRAPIPSRSPSNGRTAVKFVLPPRGAVFLVFNHGTAADPIESVDGPAGLDLGYDAGRTVGLASTTGQWSVRFRSGKTRNIVSHETPLHIPIEGPWDVQFGKSAPRQITRLNSWAQDTDEQVRHFSGTALYRTSFVCPQGVAARRVEWRLDLRSVAELALVRINGVNLPALWKPPFEVVVSHYLKEGANTLEVEVTNTWKNRLVGDAALPDAASRATHVVPRRSIRGTDWLPKATDELLPAGLLGPVKIEGRPLISLGV